MDFAVPFVVLLATGISSVLSSKPGESGGGGPHGGGGTSSPLTAPSVTAKQPSPAGTSSIPVSIGSLDSGASNGGTAAPTSSTMSSSALPLKTVGAIIACAIIGTSLVIVCTWLLYRRRLHRMQEHEVDLIAKDEIRSVDGTSPARVIEPYTNHTDGHLPNNNRIVSPIVIPGSPSAAYADPSRPLSSTYSPTDPSRPLSPTYTDASFYGGGQAKSPVSDKQPLPDGSVAGPSKLPAPMSPVFSEPEEPGTPMRERDGGVSLMSSEGVYSPLPPAYAIAVSAGAHDSSRPTSPSSSHLQ